MHLEPFRDKHLKQGQATRYFMVTACFKQPPKSLRAESRRILRSACFHGALLPELLNQNYRLTVTAEEQPDELQENVGVAPLSLPTRLQP